LNKSKDGLCKDIAVIFDMQYPTLTKHIL